MVLKCVNLNPFCRMIYSENKNKRAIYVDPIEILKWASEIFIFMKGLCSYFFNFLIYDGQLVGILLLEFLEYSIDT